MLSGRISEHETKETQGRRGIEEGLGDDHSTSGCGVISLLGVVAGLVGLESARNFGHIINDLCQVPLKSIREKLYPGQGFAFIDLEDAIEALNNENIPLGGLQRTSYGGNNKKGAGENSARWKVFVVRAY
jgi:hypothetical protein